MNNDDLRQRMLEMIHGLLSDEEQRELKELITSDPDAARAYSEVSIEANLIAEAARLEGPKVELPADRGKRGVAARGGAAATWIPWVVYLALSLLVTASIGGYLWDRSQQRDVAAEHLRLVVAAPATITPGVESRVSVRTESIAGTPLPSSVEVSLVAVGDQQKRQLLGADRVRRSDGVKPTEFVIPANLALTGPVQLEVKAYSGSQPCSMQRDLAVEPKRFVTQLGLDKPWYQPGETVYFRSLTLEGLGLTAREEMPLEFEILDPAGAPVAGSKQEGVTERGVGNGSFALPAELTGGMYTLVVRCLGMPTFAEQKKTFLVQQHRLPRLKKELELTRDSYAPGDEVVADFSSARAESGPAAGAKLQVIATVDGKQAFEKTETAAADGTLQIRFKLPAQIERGDGQLAVVVDDGGTRETAAKTIPINLGKLTVDFYPEGGDLVEGLPNRVYFTALDLAGEPVHIEGQVVDGAGRSVASMATVKDGRGSFTFVPATGEKYELKLTKPQNVKSVLALPAVNPLRSVVLSTGAGVFAPGEPLALSITSKRDGLPLAITATCRGTPVGQTTNVTGNAGATENLTLPLAAAADGVIRVTVFDYSTPKPEPIAERLVFRRAARKLNVALDSTHHAPRDATPHAEREGYYVPGQKVELKLKVTDERGQPAAATLGVAVVDDALLALAKEQTKHQPATMPTQFRLAAEIEKPEQLEDVNFYLSDDPKAAEALDLLLGTQGWRRFASVRLNELVKQAHDDDEEGDTTPRRTALAGMLLAAGREGAPVIYDNFQDIRGPYSRQMVDYDTARKSRVKAIGGLAFYGGIAALVGIAALGMLQLLRSPRVWAPAMAVATACLVMGGVWMAELRKPEVGTVAATVFRSDDVRPLPEVSRLAGTQPDANVPALEGVVTGVRVQDRTTLVQLSIGSDDGLLTGHRLRVFRGDTPLGEAVVIRTEPDKAVGRLDKPLGPIQIRDQVTSMRTLGQLAGIQDSSGGTSTGGGPSFEEERMKLLVALEAARSRGLLEGKDGEIVEDQITETEKKPGSKWKPIIGQLPIGKQQADIDKLFLEASRLSESNHAWQLRKPSQVVDIRSIRDAERRLRASDVFGKGAAPQQPDQPRPPAVTERPSKADVGVKTPLMAQFLTLMLPHFPVRQYAHRHVAGKPGVRTDFTETLYWNPLVIANAQGEATIRFELSDAVTTFRVAADAQADATAGDGGVLGRIGAGGGTIVSRIPFSLEPKLPLEVNAGDTIDLPVAVVNDSAKDTKIALKVERDDLVKFIEEVSGGYSSETTVTKGKLLGPAERHFELKAGQRGRKFFPLVVTGERGSARLRFIGTAGELADTVERTISIVPPGFPVAQSYAGRLDGPQDVNVTLPREWVPGSLQVAVQCYPTTLADLQSGMESILQEPYGCFEQTSVTNYPNVLAMQYMQEHRVADPAITRRARELMAKGYARLTGFECKQRGYEWFGADPGHEALTAYGLMQFRDMAAVFDVDAAMVTRTTDWLLGRRDGQGGFRRGADGHSFGIAPPDVINGYIVWALTESANKQSESGQKQIDTEVEHAVDAGRKSDDPYVIGLAAASAVNYGQADAARELLKKLSGKQQADGHLTGTQGSITGSGGVSLDVETTALAALAWLKQPEFLPQANKAIDWIVKNRQGSGGFGSTQGTILALKALVAHAKASRATVSGGELIVTRADKEIGRTKFAPGAKQTIALANLAEKLQPGDNKLSLKLTGENKMPYAVSVEYCTRTPVSQDACPIRLATTLDAAKLSAGGTVALTAKLTNTADKEQPMTVAILGIPGGTRPRADQLKELKNSGKLDYFELRPREIVCYWRGLAPKQTVDLHLDLVAEIPGRYIAPASRTYLYYTAEQKQWVDPVAVEIARE